MDDGSIKSKQSKGVLFNTQSFTLNEVKLLCTVLLSKFGIQASRRLLGELQVLHNVVV